VIDAIGVADQGIAEAAQIEQTIPVDVVAGESGHLETEDDADVAEGDLGGESAEAAAGGISGTGDAEVLVDDDDLLAAQPSSLARVTSAYCRAVDSRLHSTWAWLDWRR